MSYRSGGSRSRGEQGPGRAGARRGGPGDSWDRAAWGDDADWDRERRGSSRGAPGRARREYDDRGYSGAGAGSRGRSEWDDAAAEQRQYDPRRYAGGARGGEGNPRGGRASSRRSGGGSTKPVLITLAVLLIVIAVAVVGLVVLPGKINKPAVTIPDSPFATATAGATPTVADTFKTFQSDRSKYSIAYPAAWNATSDERTTQSQYDYIDTFALQNAPSRLLIEQAGAFSTYTDQQILQNEVTNAQQNGVTFTRADSPAPTQKAGGATWTRQDYEVNANGNPVHMALLACHHGGRGYVVVLVSSAGEFSNDDQAVFTPMLNSFRFA